MNESELQTLSGIYKMVENTESQIRGIKAMLRDLGDGKISAVDSNTAHKISSLSPVMVDDGSQKIIEGIFDGQSMVGSDKKSYPVPANYASKSKLLEGDRLKLTIKGDGAFLYKQIGPTERRRVLGRLMYEDGQYFAVSDTVTYNVLLASVTYFKAEVGNMLTLLVPENKPNAQWAAIENVVNNPEAEQAVIQEKKQSDTFDISQMV